MLFNSYIFIFAFLPVTLIGYFMIKKYEEDNLSRLFLLLMSLIFYGYFNKKYLIIISVSIIVNYSISIKIIKEYNSITKKIIMIIGIIFNLGLIFYFKYYDFFIENMNYIFNSSIVLKKIVLPLGISFFTFQQVSFIVDSYKGEAKGYSFLEYAVFVTFFPQLIAGPIVTHDEMIIQFRNPANNRFKNENFACGIYVFSVGIFKKVIIADTFGKAVNWGYGTIDTLTTLETLIVILSYTLQIYYDFSGYCDMASGISRMFNIELPINFNSPYKARTITEFWDRWHITLTRFLRKYVYFPLGGSKTGNTYRNILIVFLISGIWHGANWTFIIWGLLHGIANVLTRKFNKYIDKMGKYISWFFTFVFINATWVIFRASSFSEAVNIFKRIFTGGGILSIKSCLIVLISPD